MRKKTPRKIKIEIEAKRGPVGQTPTMESIIEAIKPLIPDPIPGRDGDSIEGPRGPEGAIGRDGRDGRDGQDADIESIVKIVGEMIPEPIPGKDGTNGKDGSPDSAEDIVRKINDSEFQIDASRIRGALPGGHRKSSKTVSLSELDDVDLSSAQKVNGKYQIGASGSTGSIISATNSGDRKNYTLAILPTSSVYFAIINNGTYTTDDPAFGFIVTGKNMIFNTALPSDIANTLIKLVCI